MDTSSPLHHWQDFTTVAAALDAEAVAVRCVDDFAVAEKAVAQRVPGRPVFIEIGIDPEVSSRLPREVCVSGNLAADQQVGVDGEAEARACWHDRSTSRIEFEALVEQVDRPVHVLQHLTVGRGGSEMHADLRAQMGLSLIHISEPTRLGMLSRMPSSA